MPNLQICRTNTRYWERFPGRSTRKLISQRGCLRYMAGGTIASLVLGYLQPTQSRELDLETLCSLFPENSRCQNYTLGVPARLLNDQPLQAQQLLQAATPDPIPVKGIERLPFVYLVPAQSPGLVRYAINPICTHTGAILIWSSEKHCFTCPRHGSAFDCRGQVLQGPARRPLPLVMAIVRGEEVRLVDRNPVVLPTRE